MTFFIFFCVLFYIISAFSVYANKLSECGDRSCLCESGCTSLCVCPGPCCSPSGWERIQVLCPSCCLGIINLSLDILHGVWWQTTLPQHRLGIFSLWNCFCMLCERWVINAMYEFDLWHWLTDQKGTIVLYTDWLPMRTSLIWPWQICMTLAVLSSDSSL